MPLKRPLLFTVLLSALAPLARAQYLDLDYGAFEELFGEPVTLSITGAPQRESAVPVTMEVVSAEDIRRSGARDIPGVLRHVTGVDVWNWTANGSDLSVRGYNQAFSSRLLVLVDGRQVYAEHYGYTPWSSLPVELAEIRQIEVVKGPNSALFGFNALGGVINIVTYSPRHDDLDFLVLRAGSQDLREGQGAATARWDGGGLRVAAGWRENEDFDTPQHPVALGLRLGDRRENLRVDLHTSLREGLTAELEASRTKVTQINMPQTYIPAVEESVVQGLRGLLTAEAGWGLLQGSLYHNTFESEVYYNLVEGQVFQPDQPPGFRFDNGLTVAKLESLFKMGAGHALRLALEWRDSRLDTVPIPTAEVGHRLRAASATWHWQASTGLSLTAALRHDLLALERSGPTPPLYPFSNADWDRDIHESSANLGLVWDATPEGTLRLSIARGVQLPNLYDLGGNLLDLSYLAVDAPVPALYNTGVPTLDPSAVDHVELGWRQRFSARLEVDLALFADRTRRVISTFGGPTLTRGLWNTPANIGDSSSQGLELRLEGKWDDTWRWSAGLLLQDVEDDFAPAYPSDLTLIDFEGATPEYVFDASLGWSRRDWEADVFLRHVAAVRGVQGSAEFYSQPLVPGLLPMAAARVASYTALDARLARRWGEGLELSLNGRNLLQAEQRQTTGAAVERQLHFSLDYRF